MSRPSEVGNRSEKRIRKILQKIHEHPFIKKMPDFKQSGMLLGGWPDYLVIDGSGRHWWYEVKHMAKRGALPYTRFSTQQLQTFEKLVDRNVDLEIVLDVDGHGTFFIKFSMLFYFMIHNPKLKSIPFDYIEEESIRWD